MNGTETRRAQSSADGAGERTPSTEPRAFLMPNGRAATGTPPACNSCHRGWTSCDHFRQGSPRAECARNTLDCEPRLLIHHNTTDESRMLSSLCIVLRLNDTPGMRVRCRSRRAQRRSGTLLRTGQTDPARKGKGDSFAVNLQSQHSPSAAPWAMRCADGQRWTVVCTCSSLAIPQSVAYNGPLLATTSVPALPPARQAAELQRAVCWCGSVAGDR